MRVSPIVRAIGAQAHAALVRSAGAYELLPGAGEFAYATAAGEIIWIGHGVVNMHPRAVVLDAPRGAAGVERLVAHTLVPWRRASVSINADTASRVNAGCDTLRLDVLALGRPRGFGSMLAGDLPADPLDRAALRVHAFAAALRGTDADEIHAVALPLLGLGPGLTPSGDDLVGAALFASGAFAVSPSERRKWTRIAARLIVECEARSHPISAALFRDLACGESYAPLHRLVDALVAGAMDDAMAAARELVAIGHSSGWDMLTGFMLGTTGRLAAQSLPCIASRRRSTASGIPIR